MSFIYPSVLSSFIENRITGQFLLIGVFFVNLIGMFQPGCAECRFFNGCIENCLEHSPQKCAVLLLTGSRMAAAGAADG